MGVKPTYPSEKIIGYSDYKSLYTNYSNFEKISFDYAVVEKENNIKVMEFIGEWKDIGTWNTLVSEVDTNIGEVLQNETCKNINVINELNIPIVCMGLSDIVVASNNNGILISDKEQSSYIKEYVEKINDKVLFAEKSWGKYKVIDADNNNLTVKITLNENRKMNYHYHEHRDEILTILSGTGKIILDDEEITVKEGDVVKIPRLMKHALIADT